MPEIKSKNRKSLLNLFIDFLENVKKYTNLIKSIIITFNKKKQGKIFLNQNLFYYKQI